MAAITDYQTRRDEASIDFSGANFIGLLCSALMFIAFIFMPWHGTKIVDNAAKLLADYLSGVPGTQVTVLLGIVPIGLLFPVGVIMTESGGAGFWAMLLAALGMVLQYAIAIPRVHAGWQRLRGGTALRLPTVPRPVTPYLFLLPPLLLYLIWIIGPTLLTFYLSLTNWDGVTNPSYVGLVNFERLFSQDRAFGEALINNARWLVIFITVPTTLGLGPLVLSFAVIALVWAWMYNPRLGLLNAFLAGLGVADLPGWLADRELAIWCVIAAAVWRQVGYVMVLYLAGLKNIDPSFIDAALVDGADRWNLFRRVILPLLAPVTTVVVVISIIDSLRAFDLVAIMTRGNQSTQVLANYMYMEAFNNYRMGYAAAVAVVLFALSMVFIGFYLSRVVRDELEY